MEGARAGGDQRWMGSMVQPAAAGLLCSWLLTSSCRQGLPGLTGVCGIFSLVGVQWLDLTMKRSEVCLLLTLPICGRRLNNCAMCPAVLFCRRPRLLKPTGQHVLQFERRQNILLITSRLRPTGKATPKIICTRVTSKMPRPILVFGMNHRPVFWSLEVPQSHRHKCPMNATGRTQNHTGGRQDGNAPPPIVSLRVTMVRTKAVLSVSRFHLHDPCCHHHHPTIDHPPSH